MTDSVASDGFGTGDVELGESEVDVSSGLWCEHGSARAVIRAAIETAVAELDVQLPLARAGEDPEGVHRARVACRRIRSDLRTFAPLLVPEATQAVRTELKWMAGVLGRVRDLDVLAAGLRTAGAATGVEREGLEAILGHTAAACERAREELAVAVASDRTTALLATLHDAAADPPTTGSALGRADQRLRPLVRAPWRKLVKRVDRLGPEPAVGDLHRVRLLAKRTRYAAEATSDVFGRPARRFAAAVADIQGVLGDMNDAEIAVDYLRSAARELPPEVSFAAGQLAHHLGQVAHDRRHGWERAFDRARRRSDWLG
jgi:CHAD domain-containing protein